MVIERTLPMTPVKPVEVTENPFAVREQAPDVGFADVLGELVGQASRASNVAVDKADAVARGTLDDLHGTMIAVKEAEISMKLVGSIRTKLLDAFQEIWRTNV
jgi:flagellar hook-basal body complex protein FliE